MEKTLFFVHVPKCAGMSLTNALRRDLPADRLYQNTSMIENFRTGRPDFLEIGELGKLRAVIGHWLHEAMLPFLTAPLLFATSIRHPVQRVRSQYRFDMAMRAQGWKPPSEEHFLNRNRNVICAFLCQVFPSIRADHGSALEAAKCILSGMDVVFDVPDALEAQRRLMRAIGLADPSVQPENASGDTGIEIGATNEDILPFVAEDMALYDWFTSRPPAPGGNPVHDPEVRAMFARLAERRRQPVFLAETLALRLARELHVEAPDGDAMELRLWRQRIFAAELHKAFCKLRRE